MLNFYAVEVIPDICGSTKYLCGNYNPFLDNVDSKSRNFVCKLCDSKFPVLYQFEEHVCFRYAKIDFSSLRIFLSF
jgi:hypothetical protein